MQQNRPVALLKAKLLLFIQSRPKTAGAILVSCMLVPLAVLLVQSLHWHFIVDSPILQYIAFLILHGWVPYKQIFDMNLPGIYWLHMFTIEFIGSGDLGFRIFDLICLSATCFSIYLLLKRYSRFAAYIAIVLFAAVHLAGGEYSMGQRDYCMLFFVGFGLFLFFRAFFSNAWIYPFSAGVLLGYAALIKPTIPLLSVMIFLVFIAANRGSLKKILTAGFCFLLGNLVFPAVMLVWLSRLGALQDFTGMFFNYLPLYGSNIRNNPFVLLSSLLETPLRAMIALFLLSLPFYAVVALKMKGNRPRKILYALMAAGLFFGCVHYWAQGNNFPYRLYPLYFFSLVLAGMILSDLVAAENAYARNFALIFLLLLSFSMSFTMLKTTFGKPNYINQYDNRFSDQFQNAVQNRNALIARLEQDMRAEGVQKGDTVQVFDMVQGGCDILYRLQLYQPTRFVQEIHFTHYTWQGKYPPYLEGLWQEFIGALHQHQPRFIIAFSSSGFFNDGVCNSEEYAPLCDFISKNYVPSVSRKEYTIYSRIR